MIGINKAGSDVRLKAYKAWLLGSVFFPAAALAAGSDGAVQDPQPVAIPAQVAQAAPTAPPAPAATQTSQGSIEEIVVTAAKVAQPLSKTPISITAVTQELLDAQHIEDPTDLAKIAPGLVFSSDAGSGEQRNNQIVIRGISSGNGVPTVGVYIDDSPITIRTIATGGTSSFYPNFFDLERIEVLRGPQGTLFGVGSEGGTVRFITPEPGLETYTGNAKLDIGTTDGGAPSYEAGAAVGGPIVEDKLGFRASIYYRQDGGYIDRNDIYTNAVTQQNINQDLNYSGRLAFSLVPIDGLTITPSIFAQREISGGTSQYYPATQFTTPTGQVLNYTGGQFRPNSDDVRDEFGVGSVSIKYDGFDWFHIFSNTSYNYRNQKETDDIPWITLFGLTSQFVPGDPNYADASPDKNWEHTISQELRFTSNNGPDSQWFWQGGLYYERTNQSSTQRVFSNDFNALTNALPFVFPPNFANLIGFQQGSDYDVYVHQVVQDRAEAAFGEVHYKIIPEVTIRAGLRTEYDSSYFGTQQGGPAGGGSGRGLQTPYPLVLQSESDHPLIPRTGVDWQIDDNNLVYFTAAKGARAGGPNTVPSLVSPVCTQNLAALGLAQIPQTFKPDSLWSYELGAKDRFFDNHVQIDASVFHIDWSQIQQAVSIGCPTAFYANLGSASSQGFDLSVIVQPVEGLTITGNVGYVDAKSNNTIKGGTIYVVRAGDPLPNVLPWTAQISAEYNYPVNDAVDAYFRADYQWLDAEPKGDPQEVGYDPQLQTNTPFAPNPAYSIVNLRAGVRFDDADVSIYALNAFNNSPKLEYGRDQYLVTSYFKYDYLRPVTVGFTATYKFSVDAPAPAEASPAPMPPPAPAPAPAPTPEAQREFQVFFDFDKSNITDAAARVIQAAAEVVKAGGVAHITVTGHTDTVGTARYNQGLSERRAASVKTQLVTDGVDGGEVTTIGVGKNGLLVPTKDGVREPQNRRAVIQLQ